MAKWLEGRSTLDIGYVFLLRNIYFVPFTPVNYLLGISRIPFKTYFLGTALGMIPGTTLYVYFFSRGFAFRDDPGAFLPVFAFALLCYNLIYLWRQQSLPGITAKA